MSACISRHGEYSSHTITDTPFTCDWCGAFDEDAAIAEVAWLTARLTTVEAERDRMFENGHAAALAVAQVRRLLGRWHEYADPADLHDDLRAALAAPTDTAETP